MPESSLHSEAEIIKRIRSNDVDAFSAIFRCYYEPLSFFAGRYLHDLQAAEGIVQDVFVRLWESRESLSIHTSLKSYLYASVRNACLNFIKRENFTVSIDRGEERIDTSVSQPDVQAESNELSEAIEQAIGKLAPKCRQIFTMAKYDGLSYEEIAEVLDISINTVKTQLKRALKSLGKSLQHFQMILFNFFATW